MKRSGFSGSGAALLAVGFLGLAAPQAAMASTYGGEESKWSYHGRGGWGDDAWGDDYDWESDSDWTPEDEDHHGGHDEGDDHGWDEGDPCDDLKTTGLGIGTPPGTCDDDHHQGDRAQDPKTPSPVPVPAAGLLLMGALGALGLARRRRRGA